MSETIDITPTPRILRTLGDIPFEVWQCLAELSDNSLDAFRDRARTGTTIEGARLDIAWSKDNVTPNDREIVIVDNGPGMSLSTLQNAARAGYSSNDPVSNLGLFGMGFNISTARLGEETIFLSATPDSSEWSGIRIDFAELIRLGTFDAPVVTEAKRTPHESGTKIHIRRLRDGVYTDLKNKESAIRRRLETIYSAILDNGDVEISLQGKALKPVRHCVWSSSRFVMHKGTKVDAIQEIDTDLGDAWFDLSRNRYLSDLEVGDVDQQLDAGNKNIIKRPRRLRGWIGIQRCFDTSEFGIDFIRNGRKILIGDKSLFGYENPDTGTHVTEYPVELGSTVGGRIVGELHVDYLIPTYQKNGFDTADKSWRITTDAIRGAGPILPKRRQALGYSGENMSPIGLLANAYRRTEPGTRNLALSREVSRSFLAEFRKGTPEYQNDDKWYKAAQEEDKTRGGENENAVAPVDSGDAPTDDPDNYSPELTTAPSPSSPAKPNPPSQTLQQASSEKSELMARCEKNVSLGGRYTYKSGRPAFDVTVWKVKTGQIRSNGQRVPCTLFQDGIEVDFFFDETHSLLEEYPITPKQLLLQSLAERFSVRDSPIPMQEVFLALIDNYLADERINPLALKERAEAALSRIRDGLPALLSHRTGKCFSLIKSLPAESHSLAQKLLDEAPDLLSAYQDETEEAVKALSYISEDTLFQLIEAMPEEFLDDKVFRLPYTKISFPDQLQNDRLRKISLEKVVSYLKDIKLLLRSGSKPSKSELIRYANTLRMLEDRLA
jgi:hypothetical protein